MNIKGIFAYFWPVITRYKKTQLATLFGYALAVMASSVFAPLMYKNIIDFVTANEGSADLSPLWEYIWILAGIIVAANIFYRVADYAIVYCQSHAINDLENLVLERLMEHSYTFFADNFSGGLVAKAKRFAVSFERIHDIFMYNIWSGSLQLLFSIAVLFYFAPLLSLLFVLWLGIYVFMTVFIVKYKTPKDLKKAEENSTTTSLFSDIITNILNVKIFASSMSEMANFKKQTFAEAEARRDSWCFGNHQFLLQAAVLSFLEITGLAVAVYLWSQGTISAGIILIFILYVTSAFGVLWNLGRNYTSFMEALADANEMIGIIETESDVKDIENPKDLSVTNGSIVLKDVQFAYKNTDVLFSNFSLEIPAGQKVALVGHSGAGKSTITKLLLRFNEIQLGTISIDGQDISQTTQEQLRTKISFVPQEPILFHRSLRDNIAYANPDANDQEIIQAAKDANAHQFISNLPDGYDTLVGERGIKLSGGERQRVAIARAMLKDAPILLLDEATSALDSIAEQEIQQAFEKLSENRTTLVIAHRLSTIVKMDRILVFEQGKIIEDGTHRELLDKNGVYAELWNSQSNGFIGE